MTVDDESIFDRLVKNAPSGRQVDARGRLAEGEQQSATVFDETYLNAYVAHAPIETHSAVARFEGPKVTVWASTQAPFTVKSQVAQALKMKPDDVRVITPYVGGGFGGKTSGPQAVEAARLARLTGRPVQVVWERAEEFFFDTFRPAAVVKIRSGLSSVRRDHVLGLRGLRRRRSRGGAASTTCRISGPSRTEAGRDSSRRVSRPSTSVRGARPR